MALLVVAAPAAAYAMHHFAHDPLREAAAKGLMLGFDIAALVFLLACLPLAADRRSGDVARRMRRPMTPTGRCCW